MPMYYFSLDDDEGVQDSDGTDLPDIESVCEHAAAVARELTFKRSGMMNRDWSHWTMNVRDHNGQKVMSLALADFWSGNGNGRTR